MEKCDEDGVPEILSLKLSNGKTAVYTSVPDHEVYFTKPTSTEFKEFYPPDFEACINNIKDTGRKDNSTILKMQIKELEKTYNSALQEAESLYFKNVENLRTVFEERTRICDRLYNNQSTKMSEEYRAKKKQLSNALWNEKREEERVYWMSTVLRDTKKKAMIEAAELLHKNADYIVDRLTTENPMWSIFLSHIQKDSDEVYGMIKKSLNEKGVSVSTFEEQDEGESIAHCYINGIVDSFVFVMVLTNTFFTNPYCIFQYCVAEVMGRPVVTIIDPSKENGAGHNKPLNLSPEFVHLVKNDPLQIRRDNWSKFITELEYRVRNAEKGEENSNKTHAGEQRAVSNATNRSNSDSFKKMFHIHITDLKKEVREEQVGGLDNIKLLDYESEPESVWNENMKTNDLHVQENQVIHIGRSNEWQTILGREIFRRGQCKFEIEVKKGDLVSVGIVPLGGVKPEDGDEVGMIGGWLYRGSGEICFGTELHHNVERFTRGDVVSVELDFDMGTIIFFKNGHRQGKGYNNLNCPVLAAASMYYPGTSVKLLE